MSPYSHLRPLIDRLAAASVAAAPPPWRAPVVHAIGGLRAIGFAEGTDLLLVSSSDGLGVLDCAAGTRVARDREAGPTAGDELQLCCPGIGPLAGQTVTMAGLQGGGMRHAAADGWRIERVGLAWPEELLLLVPPGSDLFETRPNRRADFTKLFDDAGLRAAGFSPTGRSLVIATGSDVMIFSR